MRQTITADICKLTLIFVLQPGHKQSGRVTRLGHYISTDSSLLTNNKDYKYSLLMMKAKKPTKQHSGFSDKP